MKTIPLGFALVLIATTLAAHAQTRYRITPVGDRSLAGYALNDKGEVAGSFATDTSDGRPYVWRNGVVVELPWANTQPNEYSEARDINDRSELIGFSSNSIAGRYEGALWRHDQYHLLEGFGPHDFVQATAINNMDEVIALHNEQFVLWQAGHYWQLPPLHAGDSVQLERLNDLGFVIGTDSIPGQGSRAVIWFFGSPVDLGLLPGTDYSEGFALNNRAQAVGIASAFNSSTSSPWLWEQGRLIALSTLRAADGYSSVPHRINDHGLIVGTSALPGQSGGARVATLWRDGAVYALDDLIRADDPLKPYLHFEAAVDINNHGQILSYARNPQNTDVSNRLYLLTPAP